MSSAKLERGTLTDLDQRDRDEIGQKEPIFRIIERSRTPERGELKLEVSLRNFELA
jgi:hypothetical protein